MKRLCTFMGIAILLLMTCDFVFAGEVITHDELLSRAEELFGGVAKADASAWKKYFAEDCLFFDEKGRSMDKAALMKEVAALPAGYEVKFTIENAQSRILTDTAILGYDIDEDLRIYGQKLGARFHTTDTWVRRAGKWQIIASQTFRYYGDPAPGEVDKAQFADYTGKYEMAPGIQASVSLEGEKLYYQRADRPKEELIPEAPRIFFRKGVEGRILFHYANDGKVDALISRRNHEDLIWKKIS